MPQTILSLIKSFLVFPNSLSFAIFFKSVTNESINSALPWVLVLNLCLSMVTFLEYSNFQISPIICKFVFFLFLQMWKYWKFPGLLFQSHKEVFCIDLLLFCPPLKCPNITVQLVSIASSVPLYFPKRKSPFPKVDIVYPFFMLLMFYILLPQNIPIYSIMSPVFVTKYFWHHVMFGWVFHKRPTP